MFDIAALSPPPPCLSIHSIPIIGRLLLGVNFVLGRHKQWLNQFKDKVKSRNQQQQIEWEAQQQKIEKVTL